MDYTYRLSPLLGRLRGRLGWHNDLAHGAARSWVIDPGRPKVAPEALYDPADLQRVCGVVHDWHSIQDEIDKIRGGPGFHGPTIAYELRGATLSGGALCTSRVLYPMQAARLPIVARRARSHMTQAVLASTAFGLKWFGHWMFDDLPLLLAARELGPPVSALTDPLPHQRDYFQMTGGAPESGDDIHFDRLVVLQDHAQNDHKQRRHAEIRRRLLQATEPARGGGNVMLLRGQSGQRRFLLNERTVAAALEKRGFTIVDPTRLSAAELVTACAGADIVVGVEGSQLAHGIAAMRRGGTVITLQPPARFSSIWHSVCQGVDLRYGFVVGHVRGKDFSIDVDGLNRLIDRVRPLEH